MVMKNLLIALAGLLDSVFSLYFYIVLGSVLASWFSADPYNPIVRALRSATEPVYSAIRRVVPLYMGGIDFTPLAVILLIQFLQAFLVRTMYQFAATL